MNGHIVEKNASGFQGPNTTWHACDDRPFVVRTPDGSVLRDSKGRVRRWGSRAAAQAVIDKMQPQETETAQAQAQETETAQAMAQCAKLGHRWTENGCDRCGLNHVQETVRTRIQRQGATHIFTGIDDSLSDNLSPFTGLPVTVVDTYPMSEAGFNCLIRLIADPDEIVRRCRKMWTSETTPEDFQVPEIVSAHGPGLYCEASITLDLSAIDVLSDDLIQMWINTVR